MKCRIHEQQKRFHSVPSHEWLEVCRCSELWKDRTTVWRNDSEDWEPHIYCLLFSKRDRSTLENYEKNKEDIFLCNSSFSFSQPWSNPEVGCIKMYLLAHYHRPWRCKCGYSLENRSFDLSVTAETREVRDMKWLSASSLLVCPGSGMIRSVCGCWCKSKWCKLEWLHSNLIMLIEWQDVAVLLFCMRSGHNPF